MVSLKESFKRNPTFYYALSICATWANAGSLLNGVTMVNKGVMPYILWAVGNTLACIVFGLFAPRIPKLRQVFDTKAMKIIIGIMCPFQCWISMNGMQTVWSDTQFGPACGIAVALAFAVVFILILLKYGMIRNVLTDHISWLAVYGLVAVVTIVALVTNSGEHTALVFGHGEIGTGIKNCILLIPGAFLYPYYFEILNYNDKNPDGTAKVNVQKSFVLGGVYFGIYLVFIFLLGYAKFSPALMIVRAVLVTLIAASSLSSFLYSMYIIFGKKLGLVLNVATVALWQFLIPLGVMGAWTLMASIRIYIVAGAIIAALVWNRLKAKQVSTDAR